MNVSRLRWWLDQADEDTEVFVCGSLGQDLPLISISVSGTDKKCNAVTIFGDSSKEWIDPEKQVPDGIEDVIVLLDCGWSGPALDYAFAIACHVDGRWEESRHDGNEIRGVLLWTPIPSLPEIPK